MKPNSIFGFRLDLALGMGPWNSFEAEARGMRPFSAHLDYKGQVNLRLWLETGLQGEPIPITPQVWRMVGDYWRRTVAQEARNDYKGDPVANPVRSESFRDTLFGIGEAGPIN
jgi:hypothetical protein